MKEFEEIDCPICNSNEYRIISKKCQFKIPLNVSICMSCGFVYLNPRWTKTRYDSFYATEYDKYYRKTIFKSRKKEEVELLEKKFAKPILQRIDSFLEMYPKHILDIGAGDGWLLKYLKVRFENSTCYAIEPSIQCWSNLKPLGIVKVSFNVESDWHLICNQKFDLIIMRHVLEHLLDPSSTLRKLRLALSENGLLYIAVPNILNPKLSLTSYCFRAVHTLYFSINSLKNMLIKSGLNPLVISPGKHELYSICTKLVGEEKKIQINKQERKKLLYSLSKYLNHENSIRFRIYHSFFVSNEITKAFVRVLMKIIKIFGLDEMIKRTFR